MSRLSGLVVLDYGMPRTRAKTSGALARFPLTRSADFEGLANFPVPGKCVEEFLHFRRGREFTGYKFRFSCVGPLRAARPYAMQGNRGGRRCNFVQ